MPTRISFGGSGPRRSRSSAHTNRAYVGARRASSSASPRSFGARSLLATVHLALRKPCPERGERLGDRRFAVGGPEGDQVTGFRVGDATELERGSGVLRHAVGLRQRRPDVV